MYAVLYAALFAPMAESQAENTVSYINTKNTLKWRQIMKSKTTALILSIFLGGLGIDRFYLGHTGLGVLKLLTGGVFGILYIIDIIMIVTGKMTTKDGQKLA